MLAYHDGVADTNGLVFTGDTLLKRFGITFSFPYDIIDGISRLLILQNSFQLLFQKLWCIVDHFKNSIVHIKSNRL